MLKVFPDNLYCLVLFIHSLRHPLIHSFIPSFIQYLLVAHCMPGMVLGAVDTVGNGETDMTKGGYFNTVLTL